MDQLRLRVPKAAGAAGAFQVRLVVHVQPAGAPLRRVPRVRRGPHQHRGPARGDAAPDAPWDPAGTRARPRPTPRSRTPPAALRRTPRSTPGSAPAPARTRAAYGPARPRRTARSTGHPSAPGRRGWPGARAGRGLTGRTGLRRRIRHGGITTDAQAVTRVQSGDADERAPTRSGCRRGPRQPPHRRDVPSRSSSSWKTSEIVVRGA